MNEEAFESLSEALPSIISLLDAFEPSTTSTKATTHKCPMCTFECKPTGQLLDHFLKCHHQPVYSHIPKKGQLWCKVCRKPFSSAAGFKSHIIGINHV